MQSNVCGNCGRPVYFAERKTSLGRDWHPNCLRCKECGKVLTPGQHAEHKGLPFCHNPCYKALFGPSILGYGSNVHSAANYRNSKPFDGITNSSNMDGISTKIFSFAKSVLPNNVRSAISQDNTKVKPRAQTIYTQEEQEMLKKVQSYNAYYEGKVRHQITTEKNENGDFVIEGPLRIYWGVTRPIQLEQCDNIKPSPLSTWRHSLYPSRINRQRPLTVIEGSASAARSNGVRFAEDIAELTTPPASPKKSYGFDDSIVASQTDGVVRRKNLRKFNTVAYRGDAPNKWKRASINGHIYNYDTSVFTPVLGSSTSVIVASTMNTSQVIKTLMEKFKVVNHPDEYQLYLVTDDEERLLTEKHIPLALRLDFGPNEAKARFFIKEKIVEQPKTPVISMPIQEAEETQEEHLPDEVETLLVLPVAVLEGVLIKYKEDEEKDARVIKMRYEQIRRRMKNRLQEMKSTQSP
ncbi:ras association domain-containing protein 2-like isoform X1 [Haliotis rufescens]|uniref:ras association domain-containing protein 2-like isoform X1 n=1 Tax=Haliotis rufescens TaxID=6454 RepID=UPI00201EC106|nr:ras association domain-containing protein 2-like isoform X1 [Haliotis rufescens]